MSANDNIDGRQRGLGKGLAVLLGEVSKEVIENNQNKIQRMLPIQELVPGKFQPRKAFDDIEIEGLATSIESQGILQPLLVRKCSDQDSSEYYEILAGERRWRAAQKIGLHEVPVIEKDLNDLEAIQVALIENLQREDLGSLEEAIAFDRLIEEFQHTHKEIAASVGKSRSYVANAVRLLELPKQVQDLVTQKVITAGHARALLGASEPYKIALEIKKRNLSVRETEELVRKSKGIDKGKYASVSKRKNPNILSIERDISNMIGLKVQISQKSDESGSLTIEYKSLDQFESILKRLK
tara:strand:- start:90777 stop:91667 length:891 start_codon:yes stop_codon:yes gene_type:complete